MKCWFCGSELIWQNDFGLEDFQEDAEGIVAILSCSNNDCNTTVYSVLDFKDKCLD